MLLCLVDACIDLIDCIDMEKLKLQDATLSVHEIDYRKVDRIFILTG